MALSNNDTLRRLRYSLNLRDPQLEQIFSLSGRPLDRSSIDRYMKREGEADWVPCPDEVLSDFLDGLILLFRGPKPAKDSGSTTIPTSKDTSTPTATTKTASSRSKGLSNNDILKKLRIALELKEEDLIAVMERSGMRVSPSELNALFRKKDHRNYKPCGDQFLRNFLTGLEGYGAKNS